MASKILILKGVDRLVAAYPAKQLQADTLELYTELLSDLPEKDFLWGIDEAIKEYKYFPTIAEIRSVVLRERYVPTEEIKEFN